jgi:hypothetical protein
MIADMDPMLDDKRPIAVPTTTGGHPTSTTADEERKCLK